MANLTASCSWREKNKLILSYLQIYSDMPCQSQMPRQVTGKYSNKQTWKKPEPWEWSLRWQSCKADETKGHNVTLKIHKDKPNEMTRQDDVTTTWQRWTQMWCLRPARTDAWSRSDSVPSSEDVGHNVYLRVLQLSWSQIQGTYDGKLQSQSYFHTL